MKDFAAIDFETADLSLVAHNSPYHALADAEACACIAMKIFTT